MATLGTAITSEQARVFAKYTKKVIITYDSDAAGQTAADKAMRLLGEVGLDVRVLKLSGAKDPDEYIKKFGKAAFTKVISESKSGFEYKLDKVLSSHEMSNATEKIKAANDISAIIAGYYSGVEREIYIRSAAGRLDISYDVLLSDVERVRNRMKKEERAKRSREAELVAKRLDDRVNLDAAKHIKANAAEEALIGLLLIYDDLRSDVAPGKIELGADDFVTDFARRAFAGVFELERTEQGFSKAMLGQTFSLEEISKLEEIEQNRRRFAKNDREVLLECIDNLKKEKEKTENSSDLSFILRAKREELKKSKNK